MYLYETHLHSQPVSACAHVSIRHNLEFYKEKGYAGVFLTDHFVGSNYKLDGRTLSYEERIRFFFSAFKEGLKIGKEIGLEVFYGFEISHGGTDFLVYGIDEEWCLAHEDMDKIPKSQLLKQLMAEGGLVIQAHPFREAGYIDHIRLFPRCIQGTEIFNACRTDFENKLAVQYRENYGLLPFSGTDNHIGSAIGRLGGMATDEPIKDEKDFIEKVLAGKAKPFKIDENGFALLA